MHVSQETFDRACGDAWAQVAEHAGDEASGWDGRLNALGLDATSTIDYVEDAVSALDGIATEEARTSAAAAFLAGMSLGIQLAQAGERAGGDDA